MRTSQIGEYHSNRSEAITRLWLKYVKELCFKLGLDIDQTLATSDIDYPAEFAKIHEKVEKLDGKRLAHNIQAETQLYCDGEEFKFELTDRDNNELRVEIYYEHDWLLKIEWQISQVGNNFDKLVAPANRARQIATEYEEKSIIKIQTVKSNTY